MDILAANPLGRALTPSIRRPRQPANTARFVFLDPRAPGFYVDWDRVADDASPPARGGRPQPVRPRPLRPGRRAVDAERLSGRSGPCTTSAPRHRRKRFHHPIVGELDLTFEAMELVADPGLTMFVYTAEPGSRSEEALNLLASWTATPDEESACRSRGTASTPGGTRDWFTGSVYVDTVAAPSMYRTCSASASTSRRARARLAHASERPDDLVLEGVGLAQRRGGPIEVIRPGDRVFFEPGEEHWHGAAPTRFMTHLAMLQVGDDGSTATWGDHVTDAEYGGAPAIEG